MIFVSEKALEHWRWEVSSFLTECWHLFFALIGFKKSDFQTEMLLCMEKLLQEKCKTFLKYISHKVTAVFYPLNITGAWLGTGSHMKKRVLIERTLQISSIFFLMQNMQWV